MTIRRAESGNVWAFYISPSQPFLSHYMPNTPCALLPRWGLEYQCLPAAPRCAPWVGESDQPSLWLVWYDFFIYILFNGNVGRSGANSDMQSSCIHSSRHLSHGNTESTCCLSSHVVYHTHTHRWFPTINTIIPLATFHARFFQSIILPMSIEHPYSRHIYGWILRLFSWHFRFGCRPCDACLHVCRFVLYSRHIYGRDTFLFDIRVWSAMLLIILSSRSCRTHRDTLPVYHTRHIYRVDACRDRIRNYIYHIGHSHSSTRLISCVHQPGHVWIGCSILWTPPDQIRCLGDGGFRDASHIHTFHINRHLNISHPLGIGRELVGGGGLSDVFSH